MCASMQIEFLENHNAIDFMEIQNWENMSVRRSVDCLHIFIFRMDLRWTMVHSVIRLVLSEIDSNLFVQMK